MVDGHPSVVEVFAVNHGLMVDRTVGFWHMVNGSMVSCSMVTSVVVGCCVVGWAVMDCLRLVVSGSAVDWIMVDVSVVDWLVVNRSMVDFSVVDLLLVDGLVVHLSVVDRLMVDWSVIDRLMVDWSVMDRLMVDGGVIDRLVIEVLWMQLSNTRLMRKLWFKVGVMSILMDLFVMRHNGLFSIFAVKSSLVDVLLRFLFGLLFRFVMSFFVNRRLSRLKASSVTDFSQLVLSVLHTVVLWCIRVVHRCRMMHDWSFVRLRRIVLLSSLGLL